jgi:hypothetical protein
MAVANVVKAHAFKIEVGGIDQFEFQKLEEPEVELTTSSHGGEGGLEIKTATRIKTGDMTLEKVVPADTADTWAWDWLATAIDPKTMVGGLPSDYKKSLVIRELNPDGSYANSYMAEGSFVKKVSKNGHERLSDDNALQTVVLSVDKYYPI